MRRDTENEAVKPVEGAPLVADIPAFGQQDSRPIPATGYTTERFAVRTVRNGCVRIGGMTFYPAEFHNVYDGRFEGKALVFGRYKSVYFNGFDPVVEFWGTPKQFAMFEEKWDPIQLDDDGKTFVFTAWGTREWLAEHYATATYLAIPRPEQADSATPESAPAPAKNPPAPTVEDPPKSPSQQGREAT